MHKLIAYKDSTFVAIDGTILMSIPSVYYRRYSAIKVFPQKIKSFFYITDKAASHEISKQTLNQFLINLR